MSSLINMLGCRYPIIQGPVGMMNSPKMTAAICEAGAFGMLALGFIGDMDEVKRLIEDVRNLTDKPFGANVVVMNPAHREILEILAASGIQTVTTSVGQPGKIYPLIHDLGMKGLHVVLSLAHAVKAAESGVDGLVVVGAEAGGLRSRNSESSTMVLVPLVADQVSIPIAAAGGIADSRGYRAALALGAQGVQIGTRFMVSEESTIHEKWKEAIIRCGDGGTALLPVQKVLMTRTVITPTIKKLMDDPTVDLETALHYSERVNAWDRGDYENAVAGAGQVSALIKDIKPVGDIIQEMVS
jgi:enoyl-[acyl-carrier protein] reductase II